MDKQYWLEYPFINKSEVCRILWGASSKYETEKMTRKRKKQNWTDEENALLEDIRKSYAEQLKNNEQLNIL